VDSIFISIGTARGSIKLYNHNQKIEHILEHFHDDIVGAVTAIDVYNPKFLLVCGYGDEGITALWSFGAKGGKESLLMYINDLNRISILSLKFINPLVSTIKKDIVAAVLSADCSGAIYRLVITKSMWSSDYAFESECLLVGSTTRTVATVEDFSVLPPLHRKEYEVSKGLSENNAWHNIELMAFSNHSKTFIVQLTPRVLILHRWPQSSLSSSIGVEKASSSMNSSLAWSWGLPSISENNDNHHHHHPLLLRSWDCIIQILLLSIDTTDEDPLHKASPHRINDGVSCRLMAEQVFHGKLNDGNDKFVNVCFLDFACFM
jgi:hypothetical protein